MTNFALAKQLIPLALGQTVFMVVVSTFFATLLAFPIGIALFQTAKSKSKSTKALYKVLSFITNAGRSFPFAILMIMLIPFTKWIIGTSLGTAAATIPLTIAAVPFLGRLVENALNEVDKTLIQSVSLMGASFFDIVKKVLIPESLTSLIAAVTLTAINLINYSAMAGLIGGGGLGQVALQYGYQRFNTFILAASVLFLLLLVECTQRTGNYLTKKVSKRRGTCAD